MLKEPAKYFAKGAGGKGMSKSTKLLLVQDFLQKSR